MSPHPTVRRGDRLRLAAALALVLALAVGRPLHYGSAPGDVARVFAFLALYVLAPGVLAWRVWMPARGDRLTQLAFGATLGIALETLAFLATRVAGLEGAFRWWPLVLVPLGLLERRRSRREAASAGPDAPVCERSHACTLGLLFLCALAVERTWLRWSSGWWDELNEDFAFHAGNAASLWRGLPFEDARVSGLISNYHYFSYALAAGARDALGVPVAESFARTLAPFLPVLLALTTFVTARRWTRAPLAALAAAALVVLHANPGPNLVVVTGRWARHLDPNSYLEYGIFHSPSMALGLVLFATLAGLVTAWFEPGRGGRWRLATAIGLLAFLASGTKGTLVPVFGAGAALVLLVAFVRRRPWRPALALCLALALPALPFTLVLVAGEGSYAGSIFRLVPLQAWERSPLFQWLVARLGLGAEEPHRALLWVAAPAWAALYFGPCGWLGCAYLWSRRRNADEVVLWCLGVLLAGAGLGLSLRTLGLSELFFLYPGQIALALFAGARLADLGRGCLRSPLAWGSLAWVLATGAGALVTQVERDCEPRPEESDVLRQYREGMEWLREHAPRDAVVCTTSLEPLVSVYGERTAFYETERSTARFLANRWEQVDGEWRYAKTVQLAYPDRGTLVNTLMRAPTAAVVAGIRERVPAERELLVVEDGLRRVKTRQRDAFEVEAIATERKEAFAGRELVFGNRAMRVYRVP